MGDREMVCDPALAVLCCAVLCRAVPCRAVLGGVQTVWCASVHNAVFRAACRKHRARRACWTSSPATVKVAADDFCAVLQDSQALLAGVNRYLYVLMAQRTGLAACHRFHTIAPRLARWLLMTQDRSDASSFHVTHQYLAFLLGVRRVGITTAAGRLQREGLITYHRGQVTVLDRRGLAAVACSCYAADRKVYAALMS